MKVIYDTDIGSDIDDAMALSYLLAQPACELLGVTTVSGEAVTRAQMVSAWCKVAGKKIPIYPGLERPFLVVQKQPLAQQASALSAWEHDTEFPQYEALDFMRHTIRANPGEVTLLATGPMTNISMLFAIDPEIPRLLNRLVMMVGVFTDKLPAVGNLEWNAICDPHAIAKIYQTPVGGHRSVGLDVTSQVTMEVSEVRKRFQTKLLHPVLDFAEVWFMNRPTVTFHDPLAAATLFTEDICGFQRGRVEVELSTSAALGMTRWTPDAHGPHEVALEVSPERFFDHFFSVLGSVS